jgi:hypothetical protein
MKIASHSLRLIAATGALAVAAALPVGAQAAGHPAMKHHHHKPPAMKHHHKK